MRIDPLFPTPLLIAALPGCGELCADLRARILAYADGNEGKRHSNTGGWQSAPDFFAWAGQSGEVLRDAMVEVVNHYTAIYEQDELVRKPLDWRINAWANVNRRGDRNETHFHPASYWSAVFYVDDGRAHPEDACGGAIEFVDPRGPVPLMYAPTIKMTIAHCANAGLGARYFPQTGEVYLFPSWLSHSVTPYTGDGVRISIAANFALA